MSGLQPPPLVRQNRISVEGLPGVASEAPEPTLGEQLAELNTLTDDLIEANEGPPEGPPEGTGKGKKRAAPSSEEKEEGVLQEVKEGEGDPDRAFWDSLREKEKERRGKRRAFYEAWAEGDDDVVLPQFKHLTDKEEAYEALHGPAENTFTQGPGRHYPEYQDRIDQRKRHLASFGVTAASLFRPGGADLGHEPDMWHRGRYNLGRKRLDFK